MRAQVGKFTLCGDGLCVGWDSADPVSRQYGTPFPFTGGKLLGVAIDVSGERYVDLELEAAAMLSRE
jgi:arylsulfatase